MLSDSEPYSLALFHEASEPNKIHVQSECYMGAVVISDGRLSCWVIVEVMAKSRMYHLTLLTLKIGKGLKFGFS